MPRLLAIDYGLKRSGLAVTDPLQLIATALDAVPTDKLVNYLNNYLLKEDVEAFIVGLPLGLDSKDTDSTPYVKKFVKILETNYQKPVHLIDERFTSKIATQALLASGASKKDRQIKGNTDKISAVIILQYYLDSIKR